MKARNAPSHPGWAGKLRLVCICPPLRPASLAETACRDPHRTSTLLGAGDRRLGVTGTDGTLLFSGNRGLHGFDLDVDYCDNRMLDLLGAARSLSPGDTRRSEPALEHVGRDAVQGAAGQALPLCASGDEDPVPLV
jgi:hypothetical protein